MSTHLIAFLGASLFLLVVGVLSPIAVAIWVAGQKAVVCFTGSFNVTFRIDILQQICPGIEVLLVGLYSLPVLFQIRQLLLWLFFWKINNQKINVWKRLQLSQLTISFHFLLISFIGRIARIIILMLALSLLLQSWKFIFRHNFSVRWQFS